jgi:hypothetical protein
MYLYPDFLWDELNPDDHYAKITYQMEKTAEQFEKVVAKCKDVFARKMQDYGNSWRVLRTPSLTDQIYIKANRIRSIQDKGEKRIEEGIEPEFIGIVNYAVMALVQLDLGVTSEADLSADEAETLYDKFILQAKELMEKKNHDYDEAWRNMRISSLTDIILMKLMRIKQIEDNEGKTTVSEGLDANYFDIINYAIFALIMLNE